MKINVNNPPKMVGILLVIVCLSLLLALGRISEAGGLGLLGLVVGYLVGNGVAARNDDPVTPALGRKDDTPA